MGKRQLSMVMIDRDNVKIEKVVWDTISGYLLVGNPMRVVVGNSKTMRAKAVHELVDEGWLFLYSGNRKQGSDLVIKAILDHHHDIFLEIMVITTDIKLAKYIMFNTDYYDILRHWYNPISQQFTTSYRAFCYKEQIFI